jgi:hypothetical protein
MPDALSTLTGDPAASAPAAAAAPAATAAAPAVAPGATTDPAAAPDPAAAAAAAAAAEPSVKLPGKDATPEQWAEFYKAVGAPDTPEAYQLPVPEGQDGEFAKTAATWFKDAGLLPQQAQALASKWNEFTSAQAAAAEAAEQQRIATLDQQNKAQEAALKTEWGQQHDANMELARRAVRQFIPTDKAGDVIAALEDRLGYAETIKFMHAIGKGLGEHDAPGLGRAPAPGRKSAAEILYGGSGG